MRYFPPERSLWFGLIVWAVVPGVVAFLLALLLRERCPQAEIVA